jgi:type VII secretion protein EccE
VSDGSILGAGSVAGNPGPVSGAPGYGYPAAGAGQQQPAAAAPRSTGVPAAKPVRRPGHVGSLSVSQIVIAEVAVLVAAAVATRGRVPGLIAAVIAVAVLAVVFARSNRRWWIEDRVIAWHRRRRHSAAIDAGAGPALAALRTLAPHLSVHDVSAPNGARVGVGRDEAGWFAAVALTPTDPAHQEAAPIPMDTLASLLADADQPGIALQLVTHTVPAPSLDLHQASPAGSSYRQLTSAYGLPPLPAHRESIVVARLDARTLAEALLDHTADPSAAAALVAGLSGRVARSLRRLGIPCRVLDADELIRALARSCDVEPAAGTDAIAQVREDATEWHSTHLTHRTFWLKTWPPADQVGPLLDRMAAVPAAQSNVAIILRPGDGEDDVVIRLLVRLAAPQRMLPELTRYLLDGVQHAGGELFPLDGEQGPGVYATAPTGGGAG